MEAIVNSIQANSTEINIEFFLGSDQLTMSLTDARTKPAVTGYKISDNGN